MLPLWAVLTLYLPKPCTTSFPINLQFLAPLPMSHAPLHLPSWPGQYLQYPSTLFLYSLSGTGSRSSLGQIPGGRGQGAQGGGSTRETPVRCRARTCSHTLCPSSESLIQCMFWDCRWTCRNCANRRRPITFHAEQPGWGFRPLRPETPKHSANKQPPKKRAEHKLLLHSFNQH